MTVIRIFKISVWLFWKSLKSSLLNNPVWQTPTQIAKFMGPTWGPPGSCRPQMGPMLAPWTCYQGIVPLHVTATPAAPSSHHPCQTDTTQSGDTADRFPLPRTQRSCHRLSSAGFWVLILTTKLRVEVNINRASNSDLMIRASSAR